MVGFFLLFFFLNLVVKNLSASIHFQIFLEGLIAHEKQQSHLSLSREGLSAALFGLPCLCSGSPCCAVIKSAGGSPVWKGPLPAG